MDEQKKLDVRFPLLASDKTSSYPGAEAFWTNHPEYVTKTWIEEITNPPVAGKERWFHIEFDLSSIPR